jgi:hypothetical protein
MDHLLDEHSTTPGGKTGIEDLRNHTAHIGTGSVADAVAADTNQGAKMIDKVDSQKPTPREVVDGYADTEGESEIDSPDPGGESKMNPLDPEQYAKAQKEARSEEHER